MSTTTSARSNDAGNVDAGYTPRRLTTETKSAFKTTEFMVFVAMCLAVIVVANFYDGTDNGAGDPFGATTAMRYVVYLTIGYFVSRGLAKSGSRERYDA